MTQLEAERLLDELARIYARAAVDALLADSATEIETIPIAAGVPSKPGAPL